MSSVYQLKFKLELGKLLVDDALRNEQDSTRREELLGFRKQLIELEEELKHLEMLEAFEAVRSLVEES